MSIITLILAGIVALEHLYIMYLETFATHSDTTSRVFNMRKEELQRDSVTNLFKNKGIYNGLFLRKVNPQYWPCFHLLSHCSRNLIIREKSYFIYRDTL